MNLGGRLKSAAVGCQTIRHLGLAACGVNTQLTFTGKISANGFDIIRSVRKISPGNTQMILYDAALDEQSAL